MITNCWEKFVKLNLVWFIDLCWYPLSVFIVLAAIPSMSPPLVAHIHPQIQMISSAHCTGTLACACTHHPLLDQIVTDPYWTSHFYPECPVSNIECVWFLLLSLIAYIHLFGFPIAILQWTQALIHTNAINACPVERTDDFMQLCTQRRPEDLLYFTNELGNN